MKKLAVVYWMEGNTERSRAVYDQRTLNSLTEFLKHGNYLSWICICEMDTYIHEKRSERIEK